MPALFKYLSTGAAEAVLATGALRWTSPPLLNDPFDVQTALTLDVKDEEVVSCAIKLIADSLANPGPASNVAGDAINLLAAHGIVFNHDEVEANFRDSLMQSMKSLRNGLPILSAEILENLSKSKYLCLSARRDILLMWAHYAEAHKGVVLEFEAKPGVDSAFICARPMNYVEQPPNFADLNTLAHVLAGNLQFDVRATIDKLVYSKTKDWEYEQEWRIDTASGRNPSEHFEDVPFFPSDLSSVTFGLRTSEENKQRWWHYARRINPGLRFWQARQEGMSLRFECLN